jgi:Na+/H+ antiporter NhaC
MNRRTIAALGLALGGAVLLARTDLPFRTVWPPLAALLVIAATRHALTGLMVGAFAGALMLAGGNPWQAYLDLFAEHLAPSLRSSWKLGAIAFTLILGGFAAVLERSGGFEALMQRWVKPGPGAARRLETAATGLGLLCFFDGLANSMVVGRVCQDLGDRCGVTRVKLAYIVDSTSSAVACVALVSTWIAFQLSMIAESFAMAGRPANPYAVFLHSLPYNFHCWFTIVLLFVGVRARFHPGPMGASERRAIAAGPPAAAAMAWPQDGRNGKSTLTGGESVRATMVPLAVLLLSFLVGFVALGAPRPLWPLTREKVVAAFGSDAGPLVLVLAGLAATAAAMALFPRRTPAGRGVMTAAFGEGVRTMGGAIFILLAAWMLGSVLEALGTAKTLTALLLTGGALALIPLLTFVTGAAISFATGTSWGTMGIMFPLAIPAAAAAGADDRLLWVTVAAVFSGAVFGDHCSPFSDTTVVTAIACGVETHDHVRTQMPYALIAAFIACVVGFLPAGFGFPAGGSLLLGVALLVLLPRLWPGAVTGMGER